MANAYNYSNTAVQATLAGSISSGALSVTVDTTTGFPGSYPFILALDYGTSAEELVKVTSAAGTTLTVTRGFGGTSAQSHSIGAVVRNVVNAQDLTDFRTHEAASTGVHGLTGSVVGTADVQTLSGKTLSAPQINNANIASAALSGTLSGSPTYTGNPTYSGTPSFTGAATFTGSPTFTGNPGLTVIPSALTNVALFVKGAASQSNDLTRWTDSVGNVLSSVTGDGRLSVTPATTTAVDHLLVNGPSGASGSANLINLKLNGSSRLSVQSTGQTTINKTGNVNGVPLLVLTESGQATDILRLQVNGVSVGGFDSGGGLYASNVTSGAWTAYTCNWTAATTNPTLGNGTLNAAYSQYGRTYTVRLELATGTTTTFGSGQYSFSLPTTAATGNITVGHGHGITSGARWMLNGIITTGGQNTIAIASPNSSTSANISFLGSAAGIGGVTWTSGQTVRMTIVYESAT